MVKSIFLLLALGISIQSPVLASEQVDQIMELDATVQNYQCPQYDNDLIEKLKGMIANTALVNAICEVSGHQEECLNGNFSLIGEAMGLANIASNPSASDLECGMAHSDQQMLHLYFGLFIDNSSL